GGSGLGRDLAACLFASRDGKPGEDGEQALDMKVFRIRDRHRDFPGLRRWCRSPARSLTLGGHRATRARPRHYCAAGGVGVAGGAALGAAAGGVLGGLAALLFGGAAAGAGFAALVFVVGALFAAAGFFSGGRVPSCSAIARPFAKTQCFFTFPLSSLAISSERRVMVLPVLFQSFIDGSGPSLVPENVPIATT